MTTLRQRMLEDMQIRNLAPGRGVRLVSRPARGSTDLTYSNMGMYNEPMPRASTNRRPAGDIFSWNN